MRRESFRPGVHDTLTDGEWRRYKRKDGRLGAWRQDIGLWYTPLSKCDLCGKVSTPKKVNARNDCFNYELWKCTPVLCTGCWNKVRPIARLHSELQELKSVGNKLRRAKNERK